MKQHVHWNMKAEQPYVLNLDEAFTPFKGVELLYKKFDFKGGEPHFQITNKCAYPEATSLVITQRYNKIGDLFDIILANDAARRMGFKDIHLILPYFPAARQDRVCNEGEPLTIKVFTDMINGCGFDGVTILCPHSEVTPALLNNVVVLDELKYVDKVVAENLNGHHFNIVCPDAGAGKRVAKIAQHLAYNNGFVGFNLIRCEKVRDVKDGSIKEFFVGSEDLGGYPTLICDDIVCGGNTFKGLGDVLRSRNCGKLMLYISHVDYVEGLLNMTNYFDHVYTTNSRSAAEETVADNLTYFKIDL